MARITQAEIHNPHLRANIDICFNPDIAPKNSPAKKKELIQHQQKLFNLVCLQSLWGAPWFSRGSSTFMTFHAMAQDLTKFSQEHPGSDLDSAIESVQQAWEYAFYDDLHGYELNQRQFLRKNWIRDLSQKTEGLEPGQKFIAPIGYTDHTIVIEITCKLKDNARFYDVKVFNSGKDIGHHDFWLDYNPFLKVPTLKFEDVDASKIDIHNMFSRLVGAQAGHSSENPYAILFEVLIGRGRGKLARGQLHHPQGDFTNACTSKALNYWVKEHLGEKKYYEFKIFRTQAAIARLDPFKAEEERVWGKRKFTTPNFFTRILYFLFNFISIEAQIALAKKDLERRERKFKVICSRHSV